MIIDSHTHVDEVLAWGWMDPPEALIPLMDEAGVDRAVIMTYRDATGPDDPSTLYIQEAVKPLSRAADRLYPYQPERARRNRGVGPGHQRFQDEGSQAPPGQLCRVPLRRSNPAPDAPGGGVSGARYCSTPGMRRWPFPKKWQKPPGCARRPR